VGDRIALDQTRNRSPKGDVQKSCNGVKIASWGGYAVFDALSGFTLLLLEQTIYMLCERESTFMVDTDDFRSSVARRTLRYV
jgi:hypothetical protein